MNKRNNHKVYHLHFITRSLEYEDGVVLKNQNYKSNICKIRIYISKYHQLKNGYEQHNEILTLMYIILNYHMKAKHKIRLLEKYINDREIDRGLEIMCNLSQAIEMDVKEKTVRKVTREVTRQNNISAVYSVMKNLNVSLDEAMDILGIPKSKRLYLEEYFKK